MSFSVNTGFFLSRSTEIALHIFIGLVFHLVFLGSVVRCYFATTQVHGMQSFHMENAGAKRLVYIVADGLRADLFFNLNSFSHVPGAPPIVAPYLREIALTRGTFGISHTRVPTESRPGHVALTTGMYEELTAYTLSNTSPITHDSIFNRSSHTFAFGAPDIIPLFTGAATSGKVEAWTFDEHEEDFTKDAAGLDVWVFNQFKALLDNGRENSTLRRQLHEDKTVFYLHLLGLDMTAHSYRPHSKAYMSNIGIVDDIVKQVDHLVADFYGDGGTAFIFTSDHGMLQKGNHGDGDPDNTRTPLIAWGSGIRGPIPDTVPSSHDAYSAGWGLNALYRRDVEQADIAALISALLGIEWPVHLMGVLPDVDPTKPGFMNFSGGARDQAEAALVNAKVVYERYAVMEARKRSETLFYKPFQSPIDSTFPSRNSTIEEIEALIDAGRFNAARAASLDLLKHAATGIQYFDSYDRPLIFAAVVLAYLGWMALNAALAFSLSFSQPRATPSYLNITALGLLFTSWAYFAVQYTTRQLYLYSAFAIYFWWRALSLHGAVSAPFHGGFHVPAIASSVGARQGLGVVLAVLAMLELAAAYTQRYLWSIGFVVVGIVWPLMCWPYRLFVERRSLWAAWTGSCLISAVFPLLDVNKQEDWKTIALGGLAIIFSAIALRSTNGSFRSTPRWVTFCQIALIVLSIVTGYSASASLRSKRGLPYSIQIFGRMILITSSLLPFGSLLSTSYFPGYNSQGRILAYYLGFGTCLVSLSISSEGLWYASYAATLLAWREVETTVRKLGREEREGGAEGKGWRNASVEDLITAVFFLFFAHGAYFGVGNFTSTVSFHLKPVFRLSASFNPPLLLAFVIYKVIAPYFLLSVFLASLNRRLRLPPHTLLLMALALADVVTLTFFLRVKDTGPWQDVFERVCCFWISTLLWTFFVGVCALGEVLLGKAS